MSEWNESDLAAYRDHLAERGELGDFVFRHDGDSIITPDGLRVVITCGWDHWATESAPGVWNHYLDSLYVETEPSDGYPGYGEEIYTPFLNLPRKRAKSNFFLKVEAEHVVKFVSRRRYETRRYAAQYHRFCDRGLMILTAAVYRGGKKLASRQLAGVDPARWRTILSCSPLIEIATGDAREQLGA